MAYGYPRRRKAKTQTITVRIAVPAAKSTRRAPRRRYW